jgi:hypothetical protein
VTWLTYAERLNIDKGTGKADFFLVDAGHARYILAMVGVLR